jgi:hypothetical protein
MSVYLGLAGRASPEELLTAQTDFLEDTGRGWDELAVSHDRPMEKLKKQFDIALCSWTECQGRDGEN